MRYIKEHRVTYSVILCSALAFIWIYGIHVLDITYTDWLLCGGDLSQHYLGWKFFRNADWQWYIGMMNNIAYPYSESVIFTDSIPLFALFFKLLSGILPQSFQYFGIWGLLCLILQGYFASLILRKYIHGSLQCDLQVIVCSLFYVMAPILLRRMYWHTSLAGQWLILAAIVLFVYHDRWFEECTRAVWCWGLLAVLCASVHLYFVPMCGVILLGFCAVDYLRYRKIRRVLAPIAAYGAGSFCTIWLLGGFCSGMDDGAPGLGYYSFNLDGFFSPQEWSTILPDIKNYADGQYEGFAYLGFGMLVLLVILMIAAVFYVCVQHLLTGRALRDYSKRHRQLLIGAVMVLMLVLMAASSEVSFGSRLLWKWPLTQKMESLWAVFRASGRLVWPAVYLLMTGIIVAASRYLTRLLKMCSSFLQERYVQTVILILFVLCFGFQLYDLSSQIGNKHQEFDQRRAYESELKSDFWKRVLQERNIRHIVFADKNHMNQELLYSFADYASEHDMTINDFYFARALTSPIEAVAADFMKHPTRDTLYIFTEEAREQSREYSFTYYEEDGLIIGVTDAFSF